MTNDDIDETINTIHVYIWYIRVIKALYQEITRVPYTALVYGVYFHVGSARKLDDMSNRLVVSN